MYSIRPLRSITIALQIIQHPIPPKGRLYSREYADACVGAVQM